MTYIYWLHLPKHTDMKSEGYIGVSNNHNTRFGQHKRGKGNNPHLEAAFQKYGEQIIKHVIWLGEKSDCYKNEEILRPEPNIGWNLNKGGEKPPLITKEYYPHIVATRNKKMKGNKYASRVWTDKEKTAQSERLKGHKKSTTINYFKPKTKKHAENISKARKGIVLTEEHKKNISLNHWTRRR